MNACSIDIVVILWGTQNPEQYPSTSTLLLCVTPYTVMGKLQHKAYSVGMSLKTVNLSDW
jgi:hypothetical protein